MPALTKTNEHELLYTVMGRVSG